MRERDDIETDGRPAPLVGRTVADVERELILETLKHCGGNRTHAANILGISIRTLRNKLHEYADEGVEITPASHAGMTSHVGIN
jgi:DNA-binding NtrC family response regulator